MIRAASMFILASVVAGESYETSAEVAKGYAGEAQAKYAPEVEAKTHHHQHKHHHVESDHEPAKYVQKVAAPAPADFQAPAEPYQTYKESYKCTETAKPNSAKYMSFVCSSLYASALKWSRNNCKGYYAASSASDANSLYQARLCTYWTEKSVLKVVSSCFIEAHLRTQFIQKHGKEGPGVWFCKYKEFVEQVMDCYGGSLKYYPLGGQMNSLEASVSGLIPQNSEDMPPIEFTGASVAMCAYYNKDQVYHQGGY